MIGNRLYPLTKEVPKSLLNINGKTILDIEISRLIDCGIEDFVITKGMIEK